MKKLFFCLFLLLPSLAHGQQSLLAHTATANSNDAITLARAPEVWNFRLGLTVDQMKERYPMMALGSTDEFGITPGSIMTSAQNRYQQNLAGIDHVVLAFVDGKLAHYSASLSSVTYYLDLDAYAARMSNALSLPKSWQPSNKLPGALMLTCPGFEVFVFAAPQPGLGMTDHVALEKVLQRWKGNVRTADRIPFSYF